MTDRNLRKLDQDGSQDNPKPKTFRQGRFQAFGVSHEVTLDHQGVEAFWCRHLHGKMEQCFVT